MVVASSGSARPPFRRHITLYNNQPMEWNYTHLCFFSLRYSDFCSCSIFRRSELCSGPILLKFFVVLPRPSSQVMVQRLAFQIMPLFLCRRYISYVVHAVMLSSSVDIDTCCKTAVRFLAVVRDIALLYGTQTGSGGELSLLSGGTVGNTTGSRDQNWWSCTPIPHTSSSTRTALL
jgi:hypothetical protein